MSDIVERLRKLADRERPYGSLPDTLDEAADEIEQLRAALRPFAWYAENLVPQIDKICGEGFYKSLEEARAALEGGGRCDD